MAENTDNNIIQTAELPEGEEINEASYKVKLESFEVRSTFCCTS